MSETKDNNSLLSIYKKVALFIIESYVKISQNFLKTDFGIFILFVPLYLLWILNSTINLLKNYQNIGGGQLSFIQFIIFVSFLLLTYLYYRAHKRNGTKTKIFVLFFLFLFFVNVLTIKIQQRFDDNIISQYHDGIPQIEASIDYFLDGKNHYTEDYYDTALADYNLYRIINVAGKDRMYHSLNPAFENYVYPPAQFVLASPIKLLTESLFGRYDHRFFIALFFIISIFVVYHLPEDRKNKLSLTIAYTFNPLFLDSLIYGYNDVTAILPLLFSLYLLKKNKYYSASFFIAISILIKYNTVFYLPFFLLYIFIKKQYNFKIKSLLRFCRYAIPMTIPFVLLLLPWLIWDFGALYHDTVYYLNHIYPIRSLGLSAYWLKTGIVQSPFEYHPFWIYQVIFLLLAVPPLIKKQFKDNSIHHVYLAGTITMIGIYFLYRYFTSSQVILIFHNLLIALFI
ncbi:hypothetical protein C0580_01305 [Candidatus Parcubacteria bacterium]|nr:MAG: hypothetical protein C0580_01305 [Candidatus Parcubacteria bacterium]